MDCVFCKIVRGELNSEKIYEDSDVLAFKDLEPQAPVHFLVIPKRHYEDVEKVPEKDLQIFEKIFKAIQHIAKELGFECKLFASFGDGENAGCGMLKSSLDEVDISEEHMNWPPG